MPHLMPVTVAAPFVAILKVAWRLNTVLDAVSKIDPSWSTVNQ